MKKSQTFSRRCCKAQIHAGGRGKGGGVKVVKNKADALAAIDKILGMQLITHQTGPEGKRVLKVYLEQGIDIDREFYISLLLDRSAKKQLLWLLLKVEWTSKK